ncbi:MAG: hypothetical protein R2880_03970 [Deinococcales bacterium]
MAKRYGLEPQTHYNQPALSGTIKGRAVKISQFSTGLGGKGATRLLIACDYGDEFRIHPKQPAEGSRLSEAYELKSFNAEALASFFMGTRLVELEKLLFNKERQLSLKDGWLEYVYPLRLEQPEDLTPISESLNILLDMAQELEKLS